MGTEAPGERRSVERDVLPGVTAGPRRAKVPNGVVHRSFGDQTVLLNLATGQYHGLNATGRRMFELMIERGSLAGVAEELAREYGRPEEEIADDLVDLCAALSERGLLELEV